MFPLFSSNYDKEGFRDGFNSQMLHAGKSAIMMLIMFL